MEEEEDRTFGLCKCCLQDGSFRSLWVAHDDNGALQNYGEMLNECFTLQWQKPDNIHLEHICDDCIKRTKDAFGFRMQVLLSQELLESDPNQSSNLTEVLDPESGQITWIVKEEDIPDPELDGEYEAIEYLELDGDEEIVDDPEYSPQVGTKHKTLRHRHRRTYKNYSREELKQCLEAVQSGSMTVAEASARYNVPRKTVASKMLRVKRGENTNSKADKNFEMVKEVKNLLTYTNMTPYKTRTSYYHCAYCSTDGPTFEDADELRIHTRTVHAEERTTSVEQFLHPVWLNEVLKVDIDNLQCTVCCVFLMSWNDMFQHLKQRHDLDFDEAYTRVIPYLLKNELRCALCKALFSNYHQMDGHMNAHYNNYMCSECGDTFLSASRLKKHLKIHETGRYPCDECGKVFDLEKYRKKHIDLVHRQQENIRCRYCEERFVQAYMRHQHVVKCHPEKIKIITCEMCGMTFDWKYKFLNHVQKKHNRALNHVCSVCNDKFFIKADLRRHMQLQHGANINPKGIKKIQKDKKDANEKTNSVV